MAGVSMEGRGETPTDTLREDDRRQRQTEIEVTQPRHTRLSGSH